MTEKKNKETLSGSLNKLEEIAEWFERERDFDIEEGLVKVKEGVELVKKLKARLKAVENEFKELQKELKVGEE